MVSANHMVLSLRDIDHNDIHYVGEKATKFREGFVVTSNAYFKFLRENNLETKIKHLLGAINFDRDDSLTQVCTHIKNLIEKSKIPDNIVYKVVGHYVDLGSSKVAAHMSIISGDPGQSKATSEKIVDLSGDAVLLETIRSLWGTLFEPGLVVYRSRNRLDHMMTGVAVTIQKK